MKLTEHCTICNKPLEELSASPLGPAERIAVYRCGHAFVVPSGPSVSGTLDFTSVNGDKQAREYQKRGIEFILGTGEYAQYAYRGIACVLADQMRIGKTPQSFLAMKNVLKERNPALIIARSANIYQMLAEFKTWVSSIPLGVWVISGSKNWIPPGFSAYIISMDTFSRKDMAEKLLAFGFKLVIADEAHSFKNPESNRSQALVRFLHDVSESELRKTLVYHCTYCNRQWSEEIVIKINTAVGTTSSSTYHSALCETCGSRISISQSKQDVVERKCGIIMLTGTPIKNRADEYFVPLNLIAPTKFPSLDRFRRNWLMQDDKGKWSRVHPARLAAFRETIAPYVLRREKEDVYADTPALNRIYTLIQIEDEHLKKLYNAELDKIADKQANGKVSFSDLQANLMWLRRLCGIAKVKWASQYVDDTLDNTDDETLKLCIGMHHADVREALLREIGAFRCQTLDGSDSAESKYRIMTTFKGSAKPVLVMNMLAGGVGMDFSYIDNILILERQWNSADEEQFEFRFYNPDRSIKNRPTSVEYVVASGTIDQWWYNMVQAKRIVFGETISNQWDISNDPASFAELVEQTLSARL
jgi:SNF2 family DNA or RNA helicase